MLEALRLIQKIKSRLGRCDVFMHAEGDILCIRIRVNGDWSQFGLTEDFLCDSSFDHETELESILDELNKSKK